MTARTVLLTGASGVVGRSLLRLVPGTGLTVVAMTRSGPTGVPEGADRLLDGDVTQPRFGLDEEGYRALAAEVDVIVHSAGLTEWGLPAERYEPVNLDGTRRVIDFARLAKAPVHFMSTAFVAAVGADDRPGAERRPPLSDSNVTANYVRSKYRAEGLLRESGVPHTLFRPTNLVGEAETGWTSRGQIVQVMSDWICRGRAPFLPVHGGNRMDFVPQDTLALAVLRAIEMGDDSGEFWVTYGEEAMDMGAAVDICAKHAAGLGREFVPPPITDPDELDEGELAKLPPMTRSYLSVLRDVSEVTRCSGAVLPSSMPLLRERYGVPHVDDTEAYRRTLAYASAHLS